MLASMKTARQSMLNENRIRPAKRMTLSRPVWDYLDKLPKGSVSGYAEALIRADATAKGTPIPDEKNDTTTEHPSK